MFNLLLALIYVCFISLGLPDSLLGSAWPVLCKDISVPVSYAGIISAIMFIGTIISSFFSGSISRKIGSGMLTSVSVAMTAVALFGFSISDNFWSLLFWAVPYGLGAGGVDAVLNNYVALHYKAQHMSWLHCFWGLGASISPYIMSFALLKLNSWSRGYLIVAIIQIVLSVIIFFSLPLWKKTESEKEKNEKSLTLKEIFSIKGAIACFLTFFAYCALEVSSSLWVSTYLVGKWEMSAETASGYASLFYIGITSGRAINGFLAMKLSDRFLIRLGTSVVLFGVGLLFFAGNATLALCGFALIGLGCAPIYPCIIHMTPDVFGRENSGSMIGIQMAFAYTGFLTMPPLFGFLAEATDVSLLPLYLLLLAGFMLFMHETLVLKTKKGKKT
ncbi:MAG: MFS transporter [Ruminococcaceae bacterium]|nr:MFS transporter [Oscillospiraceae bacterium]